MPYDPRYGVVPDGWTGPQQMDVSRYGAAAQGRGYNTYREAQAYNARHRRAGILRGVVAPVAALTGIAAAPAIFGGLGASGAASSTGAAASTGYSSPGIYGGLFGGGGGGALTSAAARAPFSLGAMLNSDAMGLGVNFLTSWMGNRSASRSNERAIAAQMAANAEATALQRAAMDESRRQFDLSQADARAANEAANEFRRRELAASEEERAYARRLMEEREARLMPYRQRANRWAMTLEQMLRS